MSSIAKIAPEFIQDYIAAFNKGNPIKEVLLEQSEGDFRCVGATCYCYPVKKRDCGNFRVVKEAGLKLTSNGEVIVVPVQKKMFTVDEVRKIAVQAVGKCRHMKYRGQIEEWFDKNY